ncbi:MAG TPA: hypothetical protein PKE38_16775 [Ignavibacteriaceae bacterium]|nr:hypothetical protein [Ignavibacteriaceae bacterium]
MKNQSLLLIIALFVPIFLSLTIVRDKWISEKQKGYMIYYTSKDNSNIKEYKIYFEKGKKSVTDFFQSSYNNVFNIFIHPSRTSLDSSWQKDWNIPDFKSQCWMVASGIADKLDMISPRMWDSLACEHIYSDTIKTQNLITHELIHVFHGQQNKSPDFSDVTGIDWFVEGLAIYASGQCDSIRILEVKKALLENKIPESLNKFWTGNLRYGLSGTVVMYLDNKYGREKLTSLLEYNTITEVLNSLDTTELEIMDGWRRYIKKI